MRPGDAVFLAAPLVVAALAVAHWRRWQLAAAIVAGLVVGSLEWVVEAYVRVGGVFARLHAATAEQGGFGLHLGILAQLRALNGPVQCRPCTIPWQHPQLSVWWLALPALVALGLFAARRAGRLESGLLTAVCGLVVAVQYLFLIDYGDPRFLIPAYALLAVPVADALAWLLTEVRPDVRLAVRGLAVAGIDDGDGHPDLDLDHFGNVNYALGAVLQRDRCLRPGDALDGAAMLLDAASLCREWHGSCSGKFQG